MPLPHHKYHPPRYKPGHYKHSAEAASKRLPPGTICACGCGTPIPETRANGTPRYVQHDGPYYVHGHNPIGKGGPGHHLWKGGRINRRGYILLHMPTDPRADSKGYVPEHRVVWEQTNGRSVQPNEHIHHINGITGDNRPENLVALTKQQHSELHGTETFRRHFETRDHKAHSAEAGRKGAAARWNKPTE